MSLAEIDLDEVGSLSSIGPIKWAEIPPATPFGISSTSSIAPSSKELVTLSARPKLEPPKEEHYLLGILRNHSKFEELTERRVEDLNQETDASFKQVEQLNREKVEILHKQAEWVKSRNTWSAWVTVAQAVGYASSVMLGVAAYSVAPWAGGLLVASGGTGFVNLFLHKLDLHETIVSPFTKTEEGQKLWAQWLETGLFVASLLFALAGGAVAYQAGLFGAAAEATHAETIRKTIASIVGTASGVVGEAAKLGEARADKKVKELQGRMIDINAHIQKTYQDLYTISNEARTMTETGGDLGERIKEFIQATSGTSGM